MLVGSMNYDEFFSADAGVLRSSIIRQLTGLVNQPDVISFAAGSPNATMFPVEQLREIFDELVEREKGKLFQYSVTRGNAELIEAIAPGREAETILVSGSQQGLDFVARVLLEPGDAAFVELPNFLGASSALENRRAAVYGVRKTAEGMDLDDLARRIGEARSAGMKPKLVYVIPNFQNPSGHTWTLDRRRELYELACRENLLIFEDDAYGRLYFDGVDPNELQPVKELDEDGRVIYMSTFSKTVAPGLRLAWITGPEEIVRRIELLKETGDLCSSTLSQKLVLEFIRRGLLPGQLERVREFYTAKCARMHEALSRHWAGIAKWNQPRGGLFLWAELTGEIDTLELLRRTLERDKVAFIPGQPFFVDGSGSNTLRLSFSNVSDENIETGIALLAKAIAS